MVRRNIVIIFAAVNTIRQWCAIETDTHRTQLRASGICGEGLQQLLISSDITSTALVQHSRSSVVVFVINTYVMRVVMTAAWRSASRDAGVGVGWRRLQSQLLRRRRATQCVTTRLDDHIAEARSLICLWDARACIRQRLSTAVRLSLRLSTREMAPSDLS